jgi:hypothetical protein
MKPFLLIAIIATNLLTSKVFAKQSEGRAVAQLYCECNYYFNPFMSDKKWVLDLVILRDDGSEVKKPLEYIEGTILECEEAMAKNSRCP